MDNESLKQEKVTFFCISKYVTKTVQELIDSYIDNEIYDVIDECGV